MLILLLKTKQDTTTIASWSGPDIYLSELLTVYKPFFCLRSEISNLLVVPKYRTKLYGERAFVVAAPTLWNKLPYAIKNSESVAAFKTSLKTFLLRN